MGEPEFFYDIEQGTPEWYELRRGIPTASEFQTILVNGAGAETLMCRLAGEIQSGQIGEGYTNFAMERGKEMEQEARQRFENARLTKVARCGFVRRRLPSGRYVGCSPDGFFDRKGGKAILEIKTLQPEKMYKACENGHGSHTRILPVLPNEHRAQCMGGLWVTGFSWVELITWYRGMPWAMEYACARDESYIAELEKAVLQFDSKLHALVQKYGGSSQ